VAPVWKNPEKIFRKTKNNAERRDSEGLKPKNHEFFKRRKSGPKRPWNWSEGRNRYRRASPPNKAGPFCFQWEIPPPRWIKVNLKQEMVSHDNPGNKVLP